MKYGRTYNFSAGPAMMPEPVLEEIRESIKNDPNLTQQDLANQLGISRSYLNKMLNWNVNNLNGEDLILIMYRLNMIRGVR